MVGRTVSHYRIVERLGSGGMGIVYRAEDTRLERPVALKFLPEEFTRDPRAVERLHREAKSASSLHHQNICTIFAFDEHDGQQFIVMELLEGQALHCAIGARPLPLETLLAFALQISDGLAAAHARGIVHRDIKPANIFVTEDGVLKVLDFGLAKTHVGTPPRGVLGDSQPTVDQSTLSGITVGTAAYMSPEQARGEPADVRSDLFSFGAVLYEMATGRQAFSGPTLGVIFDGVLNRPPVPPRVLNEDLPLSLEGVILKALAKDPAQRYQSASEMRAELRRVQQESAAGIRASGVDAVAPFLAPTLDVRSSSAKPPPVAPARRSLFRPGRHALTVIAAMLIVVIPICWWALPRRTYYSCVVVGELRSSADAVDPALLGFSVERALSQLPDLAVYDQNEYDLAQRLEQSSRQSLVHEAGFRSWLLGWRDRGPSGPAVGVRAEVQPSLGDQVVTLTITTRGQSEQLSLRYRGVDQLFMRGVDEIARLIVTRYRAGDRAQTVTELKDCRPISMLLSDHLDAVKCFLRGREAWGHLDMSSAEGELKRALEIDPRFALAHLLLAEVRVFQNRWNAAQAEITSARKQSDALTVADTLRIRALLARASGNASEERMYLQKLIGLEPYRKDYVYELAESYFHTADVEDAQANYLRALRLDEQYALAHNHLGYCYTWKGQHNRALEEFNRYLKLDQTANAYDSLGDAYFHSGDYEKAAEAKRKALESDGSLYFVKQSLAAIEILSGRVASAERIIAKSLGETADPTERARFLAMRAFLDYRTGRLEQALGACTEGLTLMGTRRNDAPSDELLWLQGQIELARQRPAAAAAVLAQIRRVLDENSITEMNYKPIFKYWLHLSAMIDTSQGRRGEAVARLDELGQIRRKLGYWGTPYYDQSFFLDASGQLREQNEQPDRAKRDYLDALAYNPHYALARFHLAKLLRRTGETSGARLQMESFLREWTDADPKAPELRQAAELIREAVSQR